MGVGICGWVLVVLVGVGAGFSSDSTNILKNPRVVYFLWF